MIKFYFDVHVHGAIYDNLTGKGIDILRAQDDHMSEAEDPELLRRATILQRVLVTNDYDFLTKASEFQEREEFFEGIIFFRPIHVTLRKAIEDLFLIAKAANPKELHNIVTFLPL